MRIQHVILSGIAVSLVACGGTETNQQEPERPQAPAAQQQQDPAPVEVAEDNAPEDGMQKAIDVYAAMVCMVADPNFWEGFMGDDDENGWIDTSTPEGEAKAAEQEKAFLSRYGYSSQEEVEADVDQYKGLTAFVQGVALKVEEQCPGLVDEEQMEMILEELK